MAGTGLRILSLDGGGTRGILTICMLRGIFDTIVPGKGGQFRPSEYFDLIGASGPNALCALLFVRFSLSIDEALGFLVKLSRQLDEVEGIRTKLLRNEVDDENWLRCLQKSDDPIEQLEELRQGIVQDNWEAAIETNISDVMERVPHIEKGKFNYKAPLAETEAGRCKAIAISSESKGYDENGGVSADRHYHVPILHRTYDCRHGKTLYTLYAVGLAAVAAPGIMKPGVIFPEFLATGADSVHNPVNLLLEESRKLWPGVRIGLLISIDTGTFGLDDTQLTSLSYSVGEACSRISDENKRIANEIERFVLPHDKVLKSAYFRFEAPEQVSFFEHSEFPSIVSSVKTWFQSATGSTLAARAASLLDSDNFPATPEDHIALASLASLLKALVTYGYMHEAELVADAISNFLLYEGASGGHGSFLKTKTATAIETLSGTFRSFGKAYEFLDRRMQGEDSRSAAQALNGLMTWHNRLLNEDQPPQELQTPSDFAAAAYFFLTLAGSGDHDTLQHANYQPLFRQLSSAVGMNLEVTPVFIGRMQALLELSSLAALCEAGNVELLRGRKRLLYNGAIIRHLHKTLITKPLDDMAECVLSPIANALALSIRVNNWTPLRDDGVASLLKSGSVSSNNPWSFVNLAIERIRLKGTLDSQEASSTMALSACENVLSLNAKLFEARKSTLATLSVKNGYFGLLTKCLTLENLTVPLSKTDSDPCPESLHVFNRTMDSDENNLLHLSMRLGFTEVAKLTIECLGMTRGKTIINSGNARGQTPLHLACMHRAPRGIFTLLWILGADRNVKCNLGRTPLHYCFPDQQLLPSPWNVVLQTLEDYALLTTVPIDLPKAYGPYGKGNGIDPRTFDFRVIIRDLVLRKADMTIADNDYMTPLHLAAREGWGDNLDIFLIQTGGDFSKSQEICLQLRDAAGFTVLDYARKTGVKGALKGGENIVVAEMKKRGMDALSERLVTPTNTGRTEPRPTNVHIPSPRPSEETAPPTHVLPPGVTFQQYQVPIRPIPSPPSSTQYTTIQPTGQNLSGKAPQQSAFVRSTDLLPSPSSTISTYSSSSPTQPSPRAAYNPPAAARFNPEASASLINQNTIYTQPVQQSQFPPAQANPSRPLSNRPVSSNLMNEGLKGKKQSSNLFKRMIR